jgi:hypothetical protein
MAREKLTFRQRDVTAVIRAVERAGHKPSRITIGVDGSINVELAPPEGTDTAPGPEQPNPWDAPYDENSNSKSKIRP